MFYRFTVDHKKYKSFRNNIIESQLPNSNHRMDHRLCYVEDVLPRQTLRHQLTLFRSWVADNTQQLLEKDAAITPLIRRALLIPYDISLLPARWSILRKIGQVFIPLRFTWPQVQRELSTVKTYEGRKYLYEYHYNRLLGFDLTFRHTYFSKSMDKALRYLDAPTMQDVDTLSVLDPDWVWIMHYFQCRNVKDVTRWAHYGHRRLKGVFSRLLVRENVVRTCDELTWLEHEHLCEFTPALKNEINCFTMSRMLRIMLAHDIDRKLIAGIFQYDFHRFSPDNLEITLRLFNSKGMSPSLLFEAVEELLWTASPENWSCVINEVGARSPTDVLRFKRLLQSHVSLSVTLIRLLKTYGAKLDHLIQCQSLILSVSQQENPAAQIEALRQLASTPYTLTVEHLAQCHEYVSKPDYLTEYLSVLSEYGFNNGNAVLAFQACYRDCHPGVLKLWLNLLTLCCKTPPPEAAADWVRKASIEGRCDAYEYIIQRLKMSDFSLLLQAAPLVKVGRNTLQFLIEYKELDTLQKLRNWYFQAHGIHNLNHYGNRDVLWELLMEDAYRRNNFAFVSDNLALINAVVFERVIAIIGTRPFRQKDEILLDYERSFSALNVSERQALFPVLPYVLEQTGGLLLKSILCHAWQPSKVLETHLLSLAPVIDDLQEGRGPVNSHLTALEADAVAMLYETSTSLVESLWGQVCDRQEDLSWLRLREHYPMKWCKAIRHLDGQLEHSSLQALIYAGRVAERFSPYSGVHIFDACKHLRARRLDAKERDPWSLAAHLGILLAIASGDSLVRDWMVNELDTTAQMSHEGPDVAERLKILDKIFSSTLPDALNIHAASFIRRLSDDDALFLAERMTGKILLSADMKPYDILAKAIDRTKVNVMEVCQRWIMREQKKFRTDKSESLVTSLKAVLTKYPAAFFAKQAVNLCTRNNVNMWNEQRHSHLVVYDPQQRRLAGMALVCIEPVSAIHRTRACLIIRAINPLDHMLASHTTESIVDAFFDVAVQIARENNLAAVLFPEHGGSHLLSNQRSIEKDIEKRYTRFADIFASCRIDSAETQHLGGWMSRPRQLSAQFYAYEQGQEKVSTLYAVWVNECEQPPAHEIR